MNAAVAPAASSSDPASARRGALQCTLALAAMLGASVCLLIYCDWFGLAAASCSLLVFAAGSWLVLRSLARWHVSLTAPQQAHARYGAANAITQFRLALSALLAGFSLEMLMIQRSAGWWLIAFLVLAATLDAVDGKLARAQGLASPLGARFDMEVDAFFLLLLSLLCWLSGKTGLWVLLAGAMRYLFVAAALPWPWLNAPLPASRRRQAVCVIQIGCLIVCLAPIVAAPLAAVFAGAGLVLLIASFSRDTYWLSRARP